jgi:hypothetical protein
MPVGMTGTAVAGIGVAVAWPNVQACKPVNKITRTIRYGVIFMNVLLWVLNGRIISPSLFYDMLIASRRTLVREDPSIKNRHPCPFHGIAGAYPWKL